MSRVLILFLLLSSPLFAICTPRQLVPPGWWGGADYLTVWRKKRYFPPLATTSPIGTSQENSGVIGLSTTTILFGDGSIVGSPVSGVQGDVGMWLTGILGIGVGAYGMGTEKIQDNWAGNPNGAPILARPFFNVQTGTEASELVSYPAVNTYGTLEIETINRIWGFDLYTRWRKWKGRTFTFDFLGGFCSTSVMDNCNISTKTSVGGVSVSRTDQFSCKNDYYAGMVGFDIEGCYGCLRLDVTGKIGIGTMFEEIEVSGNTFSNTTTYSGGLLALPSNIGNYTTHKFEIGSILDARLRYSIWGHLHLTAGYKLWYLPHVNFAGEIISLNVNTSQQNGGTLTGTTAPTTSFNQQSYWTQAITAGFYFVY